MKIPSATTVAAITLIASTALAAPVPVPDASPDSHNVIEAREPSPAAEAEPVTNADAAAVLLQVRDLLRAREEEDEFDGGGPRGSPDPKPGAELAGVKGDMTNGIDSAVDTVGVDAAHSNNPPKRA